MKSEHNALERGIPRLIVGSSPPVSGYDVDIIILMQNRLHETIEAVNAAFRQKDISFYVTVLDQGSADATRVEFIEVFKNHEQFGYYVSPMNLGVGGGRNYLSALGSGRYIVALDNDAVFADDMVVAKAAALFESAPRLGAIAFKILSRDAINLEESSWGYPQGLIARANEDFVTTTFVGAGHAIRRTAWIAVGGYDADLFFTWEEYDFCLNAIALHWSIMYAGSLAVIHKVAAEARMRWNSDRMRLFMRNRVIIGRKWGASWFALLPRIIGYLIKAKRNRRLMPALSGLFEAVMQDRFLPKRAMGQHMRSYVNAHETRYRNNVFRNLYHHVIVKQQADPRSIDSGVLNRTSNRYSIGAVELSVTENDRFRPHPAPVMRDRVTR